VGRAFRPAADNGGPVQYAPEKNGSGDGDHPLGSGLRLEQDETLIPDLIARRDFRCGQRLFVRLEP